MAGGCEKARLANIGPFRLGFRSLQRFALTLGGGDVEGRHQGLGRRWWLLSEHASAHQERSPSQARQFELDFMIIDCGALHLDRGQEFAEGGHIQMISSSHEMSPDEVLGLDRKNAME